MSSSARSRLLRGSAVLAGAVLALSACGGNGGSHTSGTATPDGDDISASPTPADAQLPGTVVRIRITDHSVTPDGSEVQATHGKPVSLLIDATTAGELHVHSSPEHHIEYPAGTSVATLTFKNPGVIDVESHALDKLIVQLEVR